MRGTQRLQYPLIKEYLGSLSGIYKGSFKESYKGSIGLGFRGLQYPLIKEYTLNYSRILIMI